MVSKARKKQRREQRHEARQERRKRAAAAGRLYGKSQDVSVLKDESELSTDAKIVKQAISQQWPVAENVKEIVVNRLVGIAEKKTVSVPCGDGVFESQAVADANAIKAISLIKSMVDSSSKPAAKQNGTTINVGVNVANNIDERRDRTLAIAERVRAGTVLVNDTGSGD